MKIKIRNVQVCTTCTTKRCSYINLASIEHELFNLSSETTICPTGAISANGPSEQSIENLLIRPEKGSLCVECGLCIKNCPYQNLSVEDYNADTTAFGHLTNLQIKAVTSLYLNDLLGFSANTNRNNALTFDGYISSKKGEKAFVEIDYRDDSLECVRRLLGDIIKYSGVHEVQRGVIVLSRLPQIGSRDIYNLLSKLKKFPTTNRIKIFITTFSHLRAMFLHLNTTDKLYGFNDIFYCPTDENIYEYQKKIERLFDSGIPPLYDEL